MNNKIAGGPHNDDENASLEQQAGTIPKGFVLIMAALMSIVSLTLDAILPVLGIVEDALGVGLSGQGRYLIIVVFGGMAVGQLISGPLSDAIGRKKVIYYGFVVYAVGTFVCLSAQSMPFMLIGRVLQGLGAAGPYVTSISIVRDLFVGRAMARVLSTVMTVFVAMPVIAPVIGKLLADVASWRMIFVFCLAYFFALVLLIAFGLKESLPPSGRIPFRVANIAHGARAVLSNKHTLIYTACLGMMFGILVSYLSALQPVLQGQFHMGDGFVYFFAAQALAFGGSSFINANLVRYLTLRQICFYAMVSAAVFSLLFCAISIICSISLWMFFAYGTLVLFCLGFCVGNLNSLALNPMSGIVGIASAIVGFASNLIAVLCGVIVGEMYDGTLSLMVFDFFALILFALALFVALPEKDNKI